ncbi:hypothetical protein [Vibrio vulnificus]|uniref:Uncharacterized protein n=1 Tax=Vibrio vulnificus TaxID=672 RepID=A0A2S3R235_VIBVL|nr:hypothetical protein [Vibrio vulnificus]POB47178.1 hypothetical protein CRN52_13950 [Vibrio vulnificus]
MNNISRLLEQSKKLLTTRLSILQKLCFRISILLTTVPCIIIVLNTVLGIVSLYSATSEKGAEVQLAALISFIIMQAVKLAAAAPVAIIVPFVMLFAFKCHNEWKQEES